MRVFLGMILLFLVIIFAPFGQAQEGTATLVPEATRIAPPDRIEQISWSPDGRYIAVAGGSSGCDPENKETEYAVRIVDALTGDIVNRFVGHNCRLVSIDWSPDGSKIVSSSYDGLSFIWDVETGELIQYGRFGVEIGVGVFWNPDSTMIASIGSGGKNAFVWSAETGKILFALPEHQDFTTSVVWNPTGTRLATSALDNTIRIWDVETQEEILLLEAESQIYWVDWSPDGSSLASANRDGTIQIWDATNGELLSIINTGAGSIEIVLWSPDGTKLASANADGLITIWDTSGERLETMQSHVRGTISIAWNPDSREIAYVDKNMETRSNMLVIAPLVSISPESTEEP
jgi:WD40 repeat protein